MIPTWMLSLAATLIIVLGFTGLVLTSMWLSWRFALATLRLFGLHWEFILFAGHRRREVARKRAAMPKAPSFDDPPIDVTGNEE